MESTWKTLIKSELPWGVITIQLRSSIGCKWKMLHGKWPTANTAMEDPTGPDLSECPQAYAGSLAQQKTLSCPHDPLMFDDGDQAPQLQQSVHVSCQCKLHLPRPCATKSGWKQLHMNPQVLLDLDTHDEIKACSSQ